MKKEFTRADVSDMTGQVTSAATLILRELRGQVDRRTRALRTIRNQHSARQGRECWCSECITIVRALEEIP